MESDKANAVSGTPASEAGSTCPLAITLVDGVPESVSAPSGHYRWYKIAVESHGTLSLDWVYDEGAHDGTQIQVGPDCDHLTFVANQNSNSNWTYDVSVNSGDIVWVYLTGDSVPPLAGTLTATFTDARNVPTIDAYFYGVNELWTTVGNWYTDYAHTSALGQLPLDTENVMILADINQTGTPTINVKGIYSDQESNVYFNLGSSIVTISENVKFFGTSNFSITTNDTIGGSIYLFDNATMGLDAYGGPVVAGTVHFYDDSTNHSTINAPGLGNATIFHNNSSNAGVGGTYMSQVFGASCEFRDNSHNGDSGGSSAEVYSTVVVFRDNSYNTGTLRGTIGVDGIQTLDVYSPAQNPLGGTIAGDITATYHGY